MKSQENRKKKTFEAALERLEKIISEMDRGKLPLEAMLKKYEEGIHLARFCSRKLEEAQKKIELLVKKDDGSFETRDFQPSEETALEAEKDVKDLGAEEEPSEEEVKEEEPLF